jgi:hypothetical protein
VTGAAGSTIDDETSAIWGDAKSLKFLGNASLAAIEITQPMTNLEPGRRYAVAFWIQGTTGMSAGTLTIEPTGTGYTAGATEEISMNAAALAAQTTFGLEYFFFTAPDDIPEDFALSIKLSGTPSAHAVYIDTGAMGPVVYHGGVHANIVRGKDKFLKNDRIRVAVSNNEAGVVQTYFGKAYLAQLPSSGSPSIADTVAT